jgi:hypothetical protein
MYLRKSYWPLPFILYLPAFIFIYHLTFKGILRKVLFSFFEDETIKMIYNFSAFKLIITSLLEELEDTKEVIRNNINVSLVCLVYCSDMIISYFVYSTGQ